MKSRLAVALATVLLLGTGIAVAVGGLSDEAMISKSYFDDVYLPSLTDGLRQRAEKGTDSTYKQAEKSLEERNKAGLEKVGGEQAAYTSAQMSAGSKLELKTGGSFLLYEGGGQLTAGTLADVTDGTVAQAGQSLSPSHRYIVTADATVTQTTPGSLGYQGEGTVHQGAGKPPSSSGGTSALPFVDVTEDSWYYGAVAFVYDRQYFSGTGTNTFSPNAPMNRAMVATVLHRISGGKAVDGGASFADVPAGQWYSDGIAWASANGVVNGMGGGLYAPELAVTREQLVTMLYRYEKDYRKAAVSDAGDLSAFPDGQTVSGWAREAMSWAVGAGLLQGRNNGALDPAGTATRAEVATILQRFSQRL